MMTSSSQQTPSSSQTNDPAAQNLLPQFSTPTTAMPMCLAIRGRGVSGLPQRLLDNVRRTTDGIDKKPPIVRQLPHKRVAVSQTDSRCDKRVDKQSINHNQSFDFLAIFDSVLLLGK